MGLDFLDRHMPHLPHSLPPRITLPCLPFWPVGMEPGVVFGGAKHKQILFS